MLLGRYPIDLAPLLEHVVFDGDLATIRQPLDFYGVSYYTPIRIGAAGEDAPMPFEFRDVVGYPMTDLGWPVVPGRLREWLIMFRARMRAAVPPIYVTASGCAYAADPDADGVVDDQARIDYHAAHLTAVAAGDPDGRRRPRLLRVVAHRRLRLAVRLSRAVRLRARRPRDPEAHQEAVVRVVRRPDRGHARRQRLIESSRAPSPSGARSR